MIPCRHVPPPYDMNTFFIQKVRQYGGFTCHHAHFDKAYLISPQNLLLSQRNMQDKWYLYRNLKQNYTEQDLDIRISRCVEKMISQGVTHCRSFIDADALVGLLPLQTALKVRERYKDQIHLEFAIQPLEGVLDPKAQAAFVKACELADVIGGLPSRDRPNPGAHLDFLFEIAKDMNKPIDVHIDQENNPDEKETEMLARYTIKHGFEGRVRGVHAISLAAQPLDEQDRIIKLLKDAGVTVIICPSAALSMKALSHKVAPVHNSIAPLQALVNGGVDLALGADNIHDLFMPMVDGDMAFECRMLMEATRCYDLDLIAQIASSRSGFRGLQPETITAQAV